MALPSSLGYEPYDARLRCLGRSLVTVLTSIDLVGDVLWRLLRLPRLSLSRRVWFTNRFMEAVLDLQEEHLIRWSMHTVQDLRYGLCAGPIFHSCP